MKSKILVAKNTGDYDLSDILFFAENEQDAIDLCKEEIQSKHSDEIHSFVFTANEADQSFECLFGYHKAIEVCFTYTLMPKGNFQYPSRLERSEFFLIELHLKQINKEKAVRIDPFEADPENSHKIQQIQTTK